MRIWIEGLHVPLRERFDAAILSARPCPQSAVVEASVLQEIGELLRDARETQGMTLDDVERITKIRRRYLEAIEDGDFSKVPGEVQLRGFVRNYAAAVGLDPDTVLGRYSESRGAAAAVSDGSLEGSKTEILVVEERRSNRLVFAAVLVILLAVIGALYYFLVYSRSQGDSPEWDTVDQSQSIGPVASVDHDIKI